MRELVKVFDHVLNGVLCLLRNDHIVLKEEQYEAVWTVAVHEEHRSLFCCFFLKRFR